MLAARAYEGETEPRLEEVERPAVGAGQVLIKVISAGLAQGVLAQWHLGRYPLLPRTLGNRGAGTVEEVGDGVTEVAVGDRVRMHPNLSCRRCEYCLTDREQMCSGHSLIGSGIYGPDAMELYKRYLDGALAEFVLVPVWAVDPLPAAISFDVAAQVHDVADALRVLKVAAPPRGATVVFTAATGTIGPAAVRLARFFGVKRFIAVARSTERLEQVRQLAPDLVETIALDQLGDDWGEQRRLTAAIRELVPHGPDTVIDFLPEGPGTWQAIASLRTGGTAVLMGSNPAMPPLPSVAIMGNLWRILGTRGCTREDARQVMAWIEEGTLQIEDLITHRFALKDISLATKTVMERTEPTWMVVIRP